MYLKCRNCGFTLIELMITVAVLSIILAIAAPSFTNLIEQNRVSTQANGLLSAANLARSEAVKLGEPVVLRPIGASFDGGWCVFAVSAAADCGDAAVIRSFDAPDAINVNDGNLAGVTFDNRGYRSAPGGDVRIELDPRDCEVGEPKRRVLSIALAGRASLETQNCD